MIVPKISIIVPVYNAENYLYQCLNSIRKQTFKDWEAVLVDDGSTDNSGKICDDFASVDNRIKVIHKENGGVSTARNRGIEECNGEWCCFVDSDDWLEPDYLTNFLIKDYTQYGCILQSFFCDNTTKHVSIPYILPNKQILKASELEYFLENAEKVHNGFLWHRLFVVDIIKNNVIRFPIGISFAEDGLFFLNYILHTDNFYITSKLGYHYQIHDGSLTSKGKKLKKEVYFYLLEAYAKVTKKIMDKDYPNDEIRNGLKLYMWRLAYGWVFHRCMNSKQDYFDNIDLFSKYSSIYGIDNHVKNIPFSFKMIISIICDKPSSTKYCELRLWMYVYDFHIRFRKMIVSIKKRLFVKK